MDPTAQSSASSSVPSNGDNSTITGDKPIENPGSIQQVAQEEVRTAESLSVVNTAQVMNAISSQPSGATGQTETPVTPAPQIQEESNAVGVVKIETPGVNAKHNESSDQIRKLGEKVEHAELPDELRKILEERIARLALIRSGSGFMSSTYVLEYEATSRYINWCTGMPWKKRTEDVLDLAGAKAIMDKNHYGLEALKQRVLEYISSIMLNIKNNGPDFAARSPILCFVGLAGTGKTTFAKSLAEALHRQFERIPFGGMADSRVLRGQSRYFPDAEPGQVIKRLVHADARNPVVLLDELDRVTETARADIMGVLIELLDPEQNAAFTDHYVDYPFNLSNCLFVATANNTASVSTAVLDRLEIIQMPSYNDEEKMMIGKNYVLPKTRQLCGLLPEQLQIDEEVWEPVIRPLGYDPGIRGLDRMISTMCRKAAMLIVAGEAQAIRVTMDNYKKFLPE